MASVKITNDIRYYVNEKIKQLFEAREKLKTQELHALHCGEELIRMHFAQDTYTTAEKLNQDRQWTAKIACVLVSVDVDGKKMSWYQNLHHEMAWPVDLSLSSEFKLTDRHSLYAQIFKLAQDIHQIQKDRKDLQSTVSEVLRNCGTLRQVLEVWPGAMEFMPDDAKKRHSMPTEKVERKKPTELSAEAQVLLVKSRMLAK